MTMTFSLHITNVFRREVKQLSGVYVFLLFLSDTS